MVSFVVIKSNRLARNDFAFVLSLPFIFYESYLFDDPTLAASP